MISPLKNGKWIEFDSIPSTQDHAIQLIKQANLDEGVIFAHHQTKGRGRFQKKWESEHHTSLSMTLILKEYSHHPQPWLLGMSIAIAAAKTLDLQLQWPNDLTLNHKKVGGILTEIIHGIPVIGVGININQIDFINEHQHTPTSIYLETGKFLNPKQVALQILSSLEYLPEPCSWKNLQPFWKQFDDTLQKTYLTPDKKTFKAVGIGNHGELLVSTKNGDQKIPVAYYLENQYNYPLE